MDSNKSNGVNGTNSKFNSKPQRSNTIVGNGISPSNNQNEVIAGKP